MKIKKLIFLGLSHLVVAFVGFALGIYSLPILTVQPAPSSEEILKRSENAVFTTEFKPNLKGNDWLHWGKGKVTLSQDYITLKGALAPGPDYKLYLSPKFVEDETSFVAAKSSMIQVGDVKTFDNFMVKMPINIKLTEFNTVIVWCESFDEFITAAQYR